MLDKGTTLAKKNETATQAKHRRVHAREITRLRHVRAVVPIFLARVACFFLSKFSTQNQFLSLFLVLISFLFIFSSEHRNHQQPWCTWCRWHLRQQLCKKRMNPKHMWFKPATESSVSVKSSDVPRAMCRPENLVQALKKKHCLYFSVLYSTKQIPTISSTNLENLHYFAYYKRRNFRREFNFVAFIK